MELFTRTNATGWNEGYIGVSARTFGERFEEHLKVPSPIYDNQTRTGHISAVTDLNIVEKRG